MGTSFVQFMKNVASNVEKRVEQVIQHGLDVLKKDNPTQEDIDSVWQEMKDLCKDLGSDASDAAKDEMKDRVIKDYQSRGMSLEDAEKYVESKFKQLWNKAEQLRNVSPKEVGKTVANTAKRVWLRGLALATAAAGLLMIAIIPGLNSGNAIRQNIEDKTGDLDRWKLKMQISVNQQQFDEITHALTSIPSVQLAAAPAAAIRSRAPITLSRPVAAVAARPVTATIKTPRGESQTVQTDVGTVYQAVPESRDAIESHATESHHEFHGNINVTAPFGAHVGLSW